MSISQISPYNPRGALVRMNNRSIRGFTSISGVGAGTAAEIDVTTLQSVAREFIRDLPDFGSVTMDGVAEPQNPQFIALQADNRDGVTQAVEIFLGGVPSGTGVTDGSADPIGSERPIASSALSSGSTTIVEANPGSLPGVTVGDYLRPAVAGVAQGFQKITNIAQTGTNVTFTTDGSSAVTGSTLTYTLYRPAMRISFRGEITTLETTFASESPMQFSLTIRISGAVSFTPGTPSLTI